VSSSVLADEAPIDPLLPVVDAHHHLYARPGLTYLIEDYLDDLRTGHNVIASVYVQARSMLYQTGPEEFRPVGETAYANGLAEAAERNGPAFPRVCAAIVGYADLLLGDKVRPVLELHAAAARSQAAGTSRFRGIRHIAAWDPAAALLNPAYPTTEDMLDSPVFRAGFAHLKKMDLSFDAWVLFHQLPRLAALARAFPDTSIVLNHCGGIVGTGDYAGRQDEVFRAWKSGLLALSACPNVMVKLGGLGMPLSGFGFRMDRRGPSSEDLLLTWRPWLETCVELFGAGRCMYESNFPADKGRYGYGIGLNAIKRLFLDASPEEKSGVFARNAARFYRMTELAL
jgi:L-fuconolactonase